MTRLDSELVARGLARSRGQARELVDAGRVRVGAAIATKAALSVGQDDAVELVGAPDPYVSRAAHKLVAALDRFGIDPAGRRCVDVGASTGGFTQVLLERGAESVCALDVGHDQLAPAVRADPRVRDCSGTTVRGVAVAALGGPFDLLVSDLSFISLTLVAADLRRLITDGSDLVLLVKPQFEVGRGGLGKGGVVRDARRRAEAVRAVVDSLGEHRLHVIDVARSPLTGTDGNVEVLAHVVATPAAAGAHDLDALIAAAVRDEPQPVSPAHPEVLR